MYPAINITRLSIISISVVRLKKKKKTFIKFYLDNQTKGTVTQLNILLWIDEFCLCMLIVHKYSCINQCY